MAYTTVDGFPGGVDRTREIFASPAGSLWTAKNGHLTRGGDFEPRKAFVRKYDLPAGTFGLVATATALVTFGSVASPAVPVGVTYQRLQHPDGLAMAKLLSSDLFDGKPYAVAEYEDGSVHHFYDGAIVANWSDGVVRQGFLTNDGIATHLAALVDADAAYAASAAGSVVTVEAAVAGVPFTLTGYAENKDGGTNDQAIAVVETVPNVPGVAEVLATASFQITGGTSNPGTNRITSVRVNGIEVLGANVDWTTSHSGTATLIAAQITTFASSPNYSASASGSTVIISAAAGTGAGPNGFVVSVTVGGDVTASAPTAMAGGVTAVSGVKQTYTATISGTFEIGDRFGLTAGGKAFGAAGNPYPIGRVVRTHLRKVYAGGDKLVNFSGLDTPAGWNRDTFAGAGFVNAANHAGTATEVTALGKYLSYLAVGFATSVQVWYMDKDDALNTLTQEIGEVGTRAHKAMVNFGSLDLFFLAENGIRSVRSREQLNLAGINDVGTPIDALVIEKIQGLTDAQVRDCCAVVEPESGRYWCAVGDRIFVFSYFPAKKVSGWTWYDPGLFFTDWAVLSRRVYGRAGNAIYLYGGDSGNEYDDDYEAELVVPFQAFGRPGDGKSTQRIDVSVVGEWDLELLVNPNNQTDVVRVGSVDGVTWSDEHIAAMVSTTHVGMRFRRSAASAGKICQTATHYERAD